jgi:predicted Rossmann fold nucleotide-binding protein DprA/Smf involved in DNA uptake
MPTLEDIVSSIDIQLQELTAEHEQLANARAALRGSAAPETPAAPEAPATPAPAPAPARSRRRKRQAKTTNVVPAEGLLKLVADSPGTTTTSLAKLAGADQAQVLTLLKEAETQGSVRREGQRRATRWYRHTDEDRIAERAAQLAKQSRS